MSVTEEEEIPAFPEEPQFASSHFEEAPAPRLNLEQDQKMRQENLIENVSSCLQSELEMIKNNFHSLKNTILERVAKDTFYNRDAMKAVECTINSLFYISPYDFGSMALNDRIVTYIHNLNRVGVVNSLEGDAMRASFGKAQDLFVIKSSKEISTDYLVHELVAGLYATNNLRNFIPNFAYVYGGFKCSPPLFGTDNKKVLSWCDDTANKVNYVLYENIAPAVEMKEYAKTCTGKQFLNVYMQIFYALMKAYKTMDFTHYDLHASNVLIRRINNPEFQIEYETEKGIEYIQTDVIATIIDYGFAHFKTEPMLDKKGDIIPAEEFGKQDYEMYKVYANKSWILHDLYKFFMYSMYYAVRANNLDMIRTGETIYPLFSSNPSDSFMKALNDGLKNFYALSYVRVDQLSLFDILATNIRNMTDCDFISPGRTALPILNCQTLECESRENVYKKIGVYHRGEVGIPSDIIEFSNLIIRLKDEGKDGEVVRVISGFDYRNKIEESIEKLRHFTKEVEDNVVMIDQANVRDVREKGLAYYNTVRLMYYQAIESFNKIRKIKILYDACIKAAVATSDEETVARLRDIMASFIIATDAPMEIIILMIDKNSDYPAFNIQHSSAVWFDTIRPKFDQAIKTEYLRYLLLKIQWQTFDTKISQPGISIL